MPEAKMEREKTMKPIPIRYEGFETFPKLVEEFFDLIARRRDLCSTLAFVAAAF